MHLAATSTTSQRVPSPSQFRCDASPSPHKSPCRPLPHSFVGFQSGASTSPDVGHLNPPCALISAEHVRSTSTVAAAAAAFAVALERVFWVVFFFAVGRRFVLVALTGVPPRP